MDTGCRQRKHIELGIGHRWDFLGVLDVDGAPLMGLNVRAYVGTRTPRSPSYGPECCDVMSWDVDGAPLMGLNVGAR